MPPFENTLATFEVYNAAGTSIHAQLDGSGSN